MSYRLAARADNDTSFGNSEPLTIPTCLHCHRDFTEFDNIDSEFCEDCQGYVACAECEAVISGSVDVDGKSYCRECATEMLREMAEAMAR